MEKEKSLMIDLIEAKRTLREWMIKERQAILPSRREKMSRAIARRVTSSPFFKKAKTVAIFLGFGSEVQTEAILEAAWEMKKTVLIPMTSRGLDRSYFTIFRRGDRLYRTDRGPLELERSRRAFTMNSVDLIFVPGLAFDRGGHRLGYGGGVYDRLLAQSPRAHRVGLYFSAQEISRIPRGGHDQQLYAIVTEKEVLRLAKAAD
jgi:5-formyltetrahydrofolate cyclo-ligase